MLVVINKYQGSGFNSQIIPEEYEAKILFCFVNVKASGGLYSSILFTSKFSLINYLCVLDTTLTFRKFKNNRNKMLPSCDLYFLKGGAINGSKILKLKLVENWFLKL